MRGPNPMLLGKKSEVGSLPLVRLCARCWVYGDCASQPFLPISLWVLYHSPNV